MTADEPLTELVRRRLYRLGKQKRFHRPDIARRLGVKTEAVAKNLTVEGRTLSLAFIEAIATAANAPLAELVVPDGSLIKQVNAEEAALLRYARLWPKDVFRVLLQFLAFFADEEPAETQTRNLHELWRRLADQSDRDWLYGVAVLMREGSLAPDLRAGLTDRLEAERNTRRAARAKHPPKE